MDTTTCSLLVIILLLLVLIIALIVYVINTYLKINNITNQGNQSSRPELIEQIKGVSIGGPTRFEQEGLGQVLGSNNAIMAEIPNPAVLNNQAILNYDYSKLYDPLVEPTRRVDRYELPKYYFRNMIDFPTRGYPDNYNQLGILINNLDAGWNNNNNNNDEDSFNSYSNSNSNYSRRTGNKKSSKRKNKNKHKKYYNYDEENVIINKMNNQNNILRLFGRQQYPGSNTWEYYITIYSGPDAIKIPLEVRRRELYTGDVVNVPELNSKYRVKLYNYDGPRYYPDLI